MKQHRLAAAVALVGLVLAGCDSQTSEVALETPAQKASYGIGLNMGKSLAQEGMDDLDSKAVAQGIEDAVGKKEQKLKDEELVEAFAALQKRAEPLYQQWAHTLSSLDPQLADELRRMRAGEMPEQWQDAQQTIELASKREQPEADFDLNVHIRVIDGKRILADSADGDEAMCQRFFCACFSPAHSESFPISQAPLASPADSGPGGAR